MKIDSEAVGLRFFRILLPGCNEKVPMPSAIVDHHTNLMSPKGNQGKMARLTVTLVSPRGKIWHVDLYKNNKNLFMGGEGWRQLVAVNELRPGYLLLFRYKGNMVFSFKVFNLSTCEKMSKNIRNNIECAEDEEVQIIADFSSELANRSCKRLKPAERNSEGGFEIIVVSSYLKKNSVLIPAIFVKTSGLSREDEEVKLRDERGRMWIVRIYTSKKRRDVYNMYISSGWLQFARANKLEAGDKCIFQLMS